MGGKSAVNQMNEWLSAMGGKIRVHKVKIHIRKSDSSTFYYIIYVTYSESIADNGKTAQIVSFDSFHCMGNWGKEVENASNKWLSEQNGDITVHSIFPVTRNTHKNKNTLYYFV